MLARCRDLDILYTRTYEDNASGKVSDERFMMISKRYDEQPALKKKISALQAVIMNIRHAAASRKSAYLHVGQGRYLPVGLPKNPAPGTDGDV